MVQQKMGTLLLPLMHRSQTSQSHSRLAYPLPRSHTYIILSGCFILRPPLLCYKDFSEYTIPKLNQTSITPEKAANIRLF